MGSTSSKTTTENKPPAWAQPAFSLSGKEAINLYNSGKGGNVYEGDTTAGLGDMTQSGISGIQSAVNSLPGQSSSGTNLLDMASGKYLKEGNPYFNDALQGQLNQTADQVQSQFSGSGRYGSGANTGVLTQQLGNIRSGALSDQFARDSQNMLTANGQIDSANSNLFQNKLTGASSVVEAGKLQDAAKQADLDAALTKFQAKDNEGWTRLGLLQAGAAGSAGNYGTGISTQQTPFNPLSAVGGVASLVPKKSDIRLKENIHHVGQKNGMRLYEWNYIGSTARFRGVMAQEVSLSRPDAVTIGEDGFMAVYYDRLGLEMEAV